MLSILIFLTVFTVAPEPEKATPLTPSEVAAGEAKHLKKIRQVTSGFARAGEGYFRPDGKAVIFQASDALDGDYQIYTQDLAPGSTPKRVSTGKGKCTCSYYHPNGQSILFASTHLDPALAEPMFSNRLLKRTFASTHLDPALAEGAKPDAKKKGPAYSRTERYRWDFDSAMDIFRGEPDGSHLVRLTDTPGYDAEGSYSPDGKQIIFTSFRDGDGEIYIMDADGKNPRRITHSKGYDGGPFFSPDGKKIIYRSDRKQNDLLQIYINNVEGTEERALTSNDAVNWGPYFHPDGRHIVYSTSLHGHQNYEVYLMDTETGKQERVTFRDGFDGLPVFSRDGKQMLWTSKGRSADNTSQLFIADFEMPAGTAAASR